MFKIKENTFENTIYIILWIVLFLFPIIILGSSRDVRLERIILEWIRFLPFLLLFVVHNKFLLPTLFLKKKYITYGLMTIICIIFSVMLFPVCREIQMLILPAEPPYHMQINIANNTSGLFKIKKLSDNIIFMVLLLALNLLLKYFFIQQRKIREEETKNKEMLQTELNFLKNQISPHFFMNTLNNIHALIDYDPNIAKETVISLSRLMRHILYESQSKRISIKKEIDFIKNYIELMRLKISEKVPISFSIPEYIPEKTIPPLIFTSLIENAFKHGVSLKERSYIKIDLSFPDKNQMECRIINSNHHTTYKEGHKGIGLENTKKRLDIEFPSAYRININKTEKEFIVILNIPI